MHHVVYHYPVENANFLTASHGHARTLLYALVKRIFDSEAGLTPTMGFVSRTQVAAPRTCAVHIRSGSGVGVKWFPLASSLRRKEANAACFTPFSCGSMVDSNRLFIQRRAK